MAFRPFPAVELFARTKDEGLHTFVLSEWTGDQKRVIHACLLKSPTLSKPASSLVFTLAASFGAEIAPGRSASRQEAKVTRAVSRSARKATRSGERGRSGNERGPERRRCQMESETRGPPVFCSFSLPACRPIDAIDAFFEMRFVVRRLLGDRHVNERPVCRFM